MKTKISFLTIIILTVLSVLICGIVWGSSNQILNQYNYIVTLQKEPNKDFVILNIGDIQLKDDVNISIQQEAFEMIEILVEKNKPDLITLTGDQTYTNSSKTVFYELCRFLDCFGIPWAPIMGNHEGEGISREVKAEYYEKCKYSLFKKGINYDSNGDYVIKIKENDSIRQVLFMMDSHNQQYYPEVNRYGYGEINHEQLIWYEKVLRKLKNENHQLNVDSMIFMHIPCPEFLNAYDEWEKNGFDSAIGFGEKYDNVGSAPISRGFFQKVKELGSTKYIFCGHEHNNDYSVLYQGIRLTFVLKTGRGCYYDPRLQGCTVIRIGDTITIDQQKYIKK